MYKKKGQTDFVLISNSLDQHKLSKLEMDPTLYEQKKKKFGT